MRFNPPLWLVAIVAMALPLLVAQACSGHASGAATAASPHHTTPPNDSAFSLMKAGHPFETYMPVQMMAVEQLRARNPQSDAIDILSQTGHFLMRHGDYVEALEYLQEASDSAQRRRDAGQADQSMIQLHGNLSSIYARFGLFDESLTENSRAYRLSRLNGFRHACDIWRMRAAVFSDMLPSSPHPQQICDSINRCLDMAFAMLPLMKSADSALYLDKCNLDRAAFWVEHHAFVPDSIHAAIRLLQREISPSSADPTRKVLLGRALATTGDATRGLALMEEGLDDFRNQDWQESIAWTLDLLAQSYAETGHGSRLAAIFPDLKHYHDSLASQSERNTLIGADFRYRLRDKQMQVEELTRKDRRSKTIILLCCIVLTLGFMLGIFLSYTYLRLRLTASREKAALEKEISDILSHQVSLNSTIETLNEQLRQKELSEAVGNVPHQLDPTLLTGDDELKFRRAFSALHPDFLKKLRDNYPALTGSDELVCMLIFLKVPPADMAAGLGISRPSLNSARYRVRKRLNLAKDTDLDTFLQTLLQ